MIFLLSLLFVCVQGGEKLKKKDQFVFKKACELIKAEGATTPAAYRALHPRIEELYRELYRETWSHPPTAKCLANVPNLTVYDDHDFVDNCTFDFHARPVSGLPDTTLTRGCLCVLFFALRFVCRGHVAFSSRQGFRRIQRWFVRAPSVLRVPSFVAP